MNSLASSASSGSSSTISSVRWPNSLGAPDRGWSERADTICGRLEELDHRLALGDALRAERDVDVETQALHALSISAVTPGYTVLRSTSSWPSRRCGAQRRRPHPALR